MRRLQCRLLFIGVLIALVGLTAVGCGPKRDKSDYRLLAVLPLSGNLAAIGTPKREAMELAIEHGRAAYPGVKILVDFQDSQGNAKDAISVINQALATKRPDFMFVDL